MAIFDVNVTSPFSTCDHNSILWRTWFLNSTYAEGLSLKNFSKANYAAINSFLYSINWIKLFATMSPSDINSLKQTINKVISLFVPLHRLGQNTCRKKFEGPAYPAYIKSALRRRLGLYYWRVRHYFGGMAR